MILTFDDGPAAGTTAQILDALAKRYQLKIETVTAAEEDVFFPLPRPLRDIAAAE